MSRLKSFCLLGSLASICLFVVGCNTVPQDQLRVSQLRARQLYQQNQSLVAQSSQASQMAQSLSVEKQQLEQQLASMDSQLQTANSRLGNLNAERSELQNRYVSLLKQAQNADSPLSDETSRRFQELANKYKDFEFDPHTGVSKFHSDILFDSGSDRLKKDATPLLNEFAAIMSDGDARDLNILVVGHTDDKNIVQSTTKSNHPTNWHLSTNRANSVVLALSNGGVAETRMGAAGYSKFQPVIDNMDDSTRSKNRRVEIFVLAPDAIVAGWDPQHSLN
ncbi:Motility protein B [Polystyrenella longa]|uniref:Motility protein B n=1 Tax=Polystyrenella longa TaxID=2528007 RepID=A0A518CT26_9PLAN|nr:OmpA family protein [Polystyrenella longa]QDU82383.1 Motility protein B [Polystyrenella longa]